MTGQGRRAEQREAERVRAAREGARPGRKGAGAAREGARPARKGAGAERPPERGDGAGADRRGTGDDRRVARPMPGGGPRGSQGSTSASRGLDVPREQTSAAPRRRSPAAPRGRSSAGPGGRSSTAPRDRSSAEPRSRSAAAPRWRESNERDSAPRRERPPVAGRPRPAAAPRADRPDDAPRIAPPADTTGKPRIMLSKNQDRRVRAGHPWVFSNEITQVLGAPANGDMVEVLDFRGAYLGSAYYNHHSLIAARLLTRGRDPIDTEFFVKRFERALRLREQTLPGATALRVVYGEADQVPGLIVDKYGDYLAVQILTLGIEARADEVKAALERTLAPRGVVRVCDTPLRELEGLPLERGLWWGEVPERVDLTMDGFQIEADLFHGQKTGLFLDQRMNRRRAEAHASGRRTLDLFCYQGEWSLHAARGGATEVIAVDSSEPALAAAARNAERNGLSERIRFVRGDVFDMLRRMELEKQRFGLVVLDPPALIKSRRHLDAGVRAYRELNRAAMSLLDAEGVLVTSSCSHHLDDELFRQVLMEAARAAKRPFRVLEWTGESPDHPQLLAVPETHYLKCAVLQAI